MAGIGGENFNVDGDGAGRGCTARTDRCAINAAVIDDKDPTIEGAMKVEPLLAERYRKEDEVRTLIELAQKLEG